MIHFLAPPVLSFSSNHASLVPFCPVGVSGSSGVSTVSRIIRFLLGEHGVESAVVEMSSQLAFRGFETLVFLDLRREGLGVFNAEGSFRPKHAVVNVDDSYGCQFCEQIEGSSVRCISFSCRDEYADFRARDICVSDSGSVFTLFSPEGRFMVHSPLLGCVNVSRVLAGMACAYATGKSVKQLVARVAGLPCIPGRFEVIDEGQAFLTVVDCAHSLVALDQLLHTIRSLSEGKLIVVFGCAGGREREKRAMMMQTVCGYADVVCATSDNPRREDQQQIFDDMLAGMDAYTQVCFVPNREEAIRRAITCADAGDAVVIAGRGCEAFQFINDTVVAFDDRLVSRAVLRQIGSFDNINPGHQ